MRHQAICITLFVCFIYHPSLANYDEDCTTPKGAQGKCVPVKSCREAFDLLLNVNQHGEDNFKDDVLALQQSKCGSFDNIPLICCPKKDIQMNPVVFDHLRNMNCGANGFPKLSGGEVAGLYDFRWMVLLKYNGAEPFACGGSLIDDRHVITAAHCLNNFKNLPHSVRLGEYDLGNESDCAQYGKRIRCLDAVQDIGIEKVIAHEKYVYKGLHHDIAILRLKKPANIETKSVRPICLPINEKLQQENPEEFMVAGWGLTEFGNRSNVLLYTSVPNRAQDFCEDSLGIALSEEHICAGGRKFQDSCRGDSGGPLFFPSIYEDGVARAIQYGVVSVGARTCGEVNVPAIYMSIPYYMQWITDHIKVENDF